MFWGLTLEVGKRYSQTVEKSFHISMAALTGSNNAKGRDPGPEEVWKKSNGQVTVMVEVEKASYPICTLQPGTIPQQALDYIFTEGEEVLFYTEGDLDVHLTGYLIDEPSPFEYSSDEESASGSNAVCSDNEQDNKKKKRKKSENESSEEEDLGTLISELDDLNEDNDEMVNVWLQRSDRHKRKKESVEDDGAAAGSSLTGMLLDNGDSEESEDDDWMPGDKRKIKKKQKAEKKSKQESKNDKSKKEETDSKESSKKLNTSTSKQKKRKSCDSNEAEDENDESQDSTLNSAHNEESPAQRELPGGLIVEDLAKGEGKKAKRGRQVSVYYKGCLQKTMKEFDSCLNGEPFTFRVGRGEVIKGWDMGVEGMQIGGKRRLTVPPPLGYGSKPMGSSIPPNSTLIFVVELLRVN